MSRQGLYVPEKAYFGAKMAVFGQASIFLGGSKSYGTNILLVPNFEMGELFQLFNLSYFLFLASPKVTPNNAKFVQTMTKKNPKQKRLLRVIFSPKYV